MTTEERDREIRTKPVTHCILCGAEGEVLYQGLRDRLYDAPGEWGHRRCPNPECGIIWLDPAPIAEDIGKAYETYYTHETPAEQSLIKRLGQIPVLGYIRSRMGYARGVGPRWYGLTWPLAYLHWFGVSAVQAQAIYLSAPAEGAKLLEIGFGDGRLLSQMRDMGWQVEGIDIDPVAVKNAAKAGLEVACGDIREHSYPDAAFDAIIMRDVLEHVLDMPGFLAECVRILKPGGRIVAAVPNADSLGLKSFGSSWFPLDPPRHLQILTHKALRSSANASGLSVVRLFSNCHFAFWMWRMSVWIKSPKGSWMSPIPRKFGALAYQMWQRALLMVRPFAGEQLVLIAEKKAP